jgi:hypothetical protein
MTTGQPQLEPNARRRYGNVKHFARIICAFAYIFSSGGDSPSNQPAQDRLRFRHTQSRLEQSEQHLQRQQGEQAAEGTLELLYG